MRKEKSIPHISMRNDPVMDIYHENVDTLKTRKEQQSYKNTYVVPNDQLLFS